MEAHDMIELQLSSSELKIERLQKFAEDTAKELEQGYLPCSAMLKALMTRYGLTREELAEKLDIELSTLYRYLNGSRRLNVAIIGNIADTLGLDLDERRMFREAFFCQSNASDVAALLRQEAASNELERIKDALKFTSLYIKRFQYTTTLQ